MTVCYMAWDTSASSGKTGDSGNHTLRWVKDGTSSATTNSPSEVDSVNLPGIYKVTITATEAATPFGVLGGKSSTANVSIAPVAISFERVPDADPGSSGGLPTLDSSNRVKADMEAIDAQATNGNNATLKLKQLHIANNSGNAIQASSTGGSGVGMSLSGDGTSAGLIVVGGLSGGHGIEAAAGSGSAAGIKVYSSATGTGNALLLESRNSGDAVVIRNVAGSGSGTGRGVLIAGGTTSGDGVVINTTSGKGLDVNGSGGNADIEASITGNLSGSVGTVNSLASGCILDTTFDSTAINAIADGELDRADAIETGISLRYAIRIIAAALAGKLSGAATTTVSIRNIGDSKTRVTATVDADGNRSAVTVDGT